MMIKGQSKQTALIDALEQDQQLRELLSSDSANSKKRELETLMALGGSVFLAGQEFPAPTLGTLLLLEMMNSPFVSSGPLTGWDVIRACCLLRVRERGAVLLLAVKCHEEEEGAWEEFDRIAGEEVPFADIDTISRAADDFRQFLLLNGGFALLPRRRESRGKLSAESLAETAAMVTMVFPALTPFELTWRIPYAQAGFLVLQAARRIGVKGIGREEDSRAVWKRLKELQSNQETGGRK